MSKVGPDKPASDAHQLRVHVNASVVRALTPTMVDFSSTDCRGGTRRQLLTSIHRTPEAAQRMVPPEAAAPGRSSQCGTAVSWAYRQFAIPAWSVLGVRLPALLTVWDPRFPGLTANLQHKPGVRLPVAPHSVGPAVSRAYRHNLPHTQRHTVNIAFPHNGNNGSAWHEQHFRVAEAFWRRLTTSIFIADEANAPKLPEHIRATRQHNKGEHVRAGVEVPLHGCRNQHRTS